MDPLTPATLFISLAKLESLTQQFLVQGKIIAEADREFATALLSCFFNFAVASAEGESNGESKAESKAESENPFQQSPSSQLSRKQISQLDFSQPDFSSIGKVVSKNGTKKLNKIVPLHSKSFIDHTASSTTAGALGTPEATVFVKNLNVDAEIESATALQMDAVPQTYTEAEDEMIVTAAALNTTLKMKGAIPYKEYKTTFSTTKHLRGFYNDKEGDIYTTASFTIRGNHSHVAARFFNYNYHCTNPAFGQMNKGLFEHEVYLETPNKHSAIYCASWEFPSPISNREAIVHICWKRLSEKKIVVAYHPLTSHPKVENKDGDSVIRGSFQAVYYVTQLDDGTVEVNMGCHLNFGGHLPKAVVKGFMIPDNNRVVSHHTVYFANSIALDALEEKDGKLLGEILVNQIKASRKNGGWKKRADLGKVGVDQFLYISVAMRKLLPKHPWLRALLREISLNQTKVAPTVRTALADMKDPDAVNLAKGLSTIIISNTEASAAVDHWIAQNVALEEFEKENAWMRPFFAELAQYNLSTSNLGLRLRVFGGALLSTIDLVTDIYMTVQFFNTEDQAQYGRINAWLISLTMLVQILVSYAQNHRKLSAFLQDTAAVLVGFKPALDAYRVGSGAERKEHQLFTPLHEMSYCKGTEMVFEAVPSSIVQIYAILQAKDKGVDALASIIVSAMTVAFTSSMISYDWDTSPSQRSTASFAYGYVPDKALRRAVCFLSMMSLSFAHVMLQTFSCALLAVINPNWLVYYLCSNMALFILYKIATRDFLYYPNFSTGLRFVISVFERFIVKIITDFTMMIHMRGSCEMGGFSFLLSVLTSLVSCFVSVHLYSTNYEGEDKLDAEVLQVILGSLCGVWIISLGALVSVMNRRYLRTFYNFDTASEYNRKIVLSYRDDQEDLKAVCLLDHPDVYAEWGDEVLKPWTLMNWGRWEEEKPSWFSDAWIECVPNDYIPYDFRVKYKKTKGRVDDDQLKKRRGSISVRELFGGTEEK
ncbi:hypothetical protein TL16_g04058 [Triparma laevis f. inornata]|uniref:Uncharacterized protein n=1 Tax=Triparma laevis f. inornata TaxID=1714386 RepID=A0A9W7A685_9STRA|nr:hypothetical protein TL16_g04058 [Triparma laevis f. inornata]